MQVFRAYFKVMRSVKVSLLLNMGIFMALAVLFSGMEPKTNETMFEPTKTPIAIINRDANNPLAQGLEEFLSQVGQRVVLPDDKEALQDALFYRRVQYIAIIPEGFSEAFLKADNPQVQKVTVPGSTSSYHMDMNIDKFLNTIRFHHIYSEENSQVQLVALAMDDLRTETRVDIKQFGGSGELEPGYSYFFRYCAYALLAMVVSGISSIMIAFNRQDLFMRNRCAPLPQRKVNMQLLAGHGTFAFVCWALLMIQSFVLYGGSLIGSGLVGFYSLNTLAFTLVCVSIGFLVGDTTKNHSMQAGVVQVIALGLNFLGGVFVPQSIMSKPVLAVAKFLPSFWFVRANDLITTVGAFSRENVLPIYANIGIQVGFAIAISSVALLLRKERRLSRFA